MTFFLRYVLPLLALVPGRVTGQDNHCQGPTYIQMYRDEGGRDVRLTCVADYGNQGDLLVGGMAGGDIILSRLSAEGDIYWQRSFATGSESTELTLLNGLVVDPEGMIAGVASHFAGDRQHALLFRYNPVTDRLLYFSKAPFESDPTGIRVGEEGEYIVSGSAIGAPSPIFRRAYFQRFRRSDGTPLGQGQLFDLAGEETIFDLAPRPAGGYYAAGSVSVRGSAGSARSNLLQLDGEGRQLRNRIGPVDDDRNARLFAFDVEADGQSVYVLQWGDLDRITGAPGTNPIITAFDPAGKVRWTRRYDLLESSGEVGIEMARHDGGLLLYGYTMVGKREIFLAQLELTGDIRWVRTYSFPGNAQVYQRANQQLLVRPDRIVVTATYSFRGDRPHEGLLLQLDAEGRPLADCLDTADPATTVSNLSATWYDRTLIDTVSVAEWIPTPAARPNRPLLSYDDCDRPCADCTERSFSTVALCPGDSVRIAGAWRSSPGLYTDPLKTGSGQCDSLVTTELVVIEPPTATYTQLPGCGLAGGTVVVSPAGGLPPYQYQWSDGDRKGPRATLDPGTYSVTVTDTTGCRPFVLPVTVEAAVDSDLTLVAFPPTCAGMTDGSIQLLPTGTGSLKLLTDTFFRSDALTGLSSGPKSFIVRLEGGCEVYREAVVPQAKPFSVTLVGPDRSRLGDGATFTAELMGGTSPISFQWSADSTFTCRECPELNVTSRSTRYIEVSATDGNGCTAADSLFHLVERGAPRVYLPTAFSPNGDGHNDRWEPGLGPDISEILDWRVFHRWGTLVWTYTPASGDFWGGGVAGTAGGHSAAGVGTYVYAMTVRLIDGTTAELLGEVTVVR
ncbi:T9SS type B sorting domain-containing protein [Neolewinella litorea]|uniref:T9SS type B sorting domain-containing protein n=1 Tax=Neolewinella litorea TaxID=2562452 RepID=A0A4S4NN00_9BACT|nr:gliding motility-associated C-terminal domain-containing protein [Neolewinella litorea]THH41202.1 hypothetical protein E4021_00990 [Neolewinella litorea]